MEELTPEQQQHLEALEQAVEQAVYDVEPPPTAESLGAQMADYLIEAAAQKISPEHAEMVRQSAAAFAAQQQQLIKQQQQQQQGEESGATGTEPSVPITPAEMVRLIQESRELILSQSAREYVQSQIRQIEQELRELRLSGIVITGEEIDAIMRSAIEQRRDPADVFRDYAYQRLKARFVYGSVDDPNPTAFVRQSASHQASQPEGYQPPEWMRQWLRRNAPEQNNPLQSPENIEPPDFEVFLRDYMSGRY